MSSIESSVGVGGGRITKGLVEVDGSSKDRRRRHLRARECRLDDSENAQNYITIADPPATSSAC